MTQPSAGTGNGSVTAAITTARPTVSGEAMPVEIIALGGECDLSNVGQLEHAIDHGFAVGARHFIADLSEVDFLDGRSVHALRDGWKRAARRNGRLVLVNPPARIWRMLVLSGASQTFVTFTSRQEALTYIADGHAEDQRGRRTSACANAATNPNATPLSSI